MILFNEIEHKFGGERMKSDRNREIPVKIERSLWGISAGIFYYLFLLLASVCIGDMTASWVQLLTTCALCLGGGMLGGILS